MWAHRDLDIYYQGSLVYSSRVEEFCGCGRPYDDLSDGIGFRLRIKKATSEPQEFIEWLHTPELCKFCYYKNELDNGRWAPRVVRQAYGISD